MEKLVHKRLKLALKKSMFDLTGRSEYGYQNELMVTFAARKKGRELIRHMPEEVFAKMKGQEVFVMGVRDPVPTLHLLIRAYPNAIIMVRKNPK